MAMNIIGGKRQVVFAKQTINLSDTPINAGNTRIIFQFEPQEGSWKPGRDVNIFSSLILNRGYLFDAISDMDLTDLFDTPPFAYGSGNSLLAEDGTEIIPES